MSCPARIDSGAARRARHDGSVPRGAAHGATPRRCGSLPSPDTTSAGRARMDSTLWAIVDTAAVVTVIALLLANVQRPERRLKHRPDRLYGSDTPDFRRAIGSLLGPAV